MRGSPPAYLTDTRSFDAASLPIPAEGPRSVLLRLLSSHDIASKRWIYRQYDHQVQTNTIQGPGGDAAVLRVKGTQKGIAVTTDGNGRYAYLDPFVGGAIAIAEACRNLACAGAEAIALTDCLNFGSPERPDGYYQLEECVKGMAAACDAFGVPVISGNVSLYNETMGEAVWPTPVVGGLGLLEDASRQCNSAFKDAGDAVVLLGQSEVDAKTEAIGVSSYLQVVHGIVAGQPAIDLDLEVRVQRLCRRAIEQGLLKSAHDCADGGLAVCLAESCIAGGIGFTSDFPVPERWDAALFGEAQSRIVVSLNGENMARLEALASEEGVPWARLGEIGGEHLRVSTLLDVPVAELRTAWEGGLEAALG